MEVIGVLIGLGMFLFYLAAPIVALIRATRAERAVRKNDARLQELTAHAHSLDRAIAELKELLAKFPILDHEVRRLKESTAFKVSEPAVAPPLPEIPVPPAKASVEVPPSVAEFRTPHEKVPPPPGAPPRLESIPTTGKPLAPEPVPAAVKTEKPPVEPSRVTPPPVPLPKAVEIPPPPPPTPVQPGRIAAKPLAPPPGQVPSKVSPPLHAGPLAHPQPPAEKPKVPEPVHEPGPPVERHIPSSARPEGRVSPPVPPPRFATRPAPGPSMSDRLKSILNVEETLGTNWLNKLGVIILVIGVSLYLGFQLQRSGPGPKVFVGYAVSLAMLGAGIFFERRERWRILARAGIGGGWALLFFVTYAIHHVEAARILHSEAADLVLLLLVAAAMVAHTLKYRSQVVTGLSFFLAFTTVTISHVSVYSLVASGILALAMVVVVWRMRWYELEVFGILATFLNHYYWLRPIIGGVGAHHAFAEYQASSALLIFYWLLFGASYVVRRIKEQREENISTVAALLNIGLFLGIMGYQAVHPSHPFWFFFAVGLAELTLGQLPVTRRRRTAFVLLTTVGAILLVMAFPYQYQDSDANLSIVWLAEAEAFFMAGIFAREIVFRRLGMLAALLTAGQILIFDTSQIVELRTKAGADLPLPHLALIYGVAALALYFNAHAATRRWPDPAENDFDGFLFRGASYVAGLLAVLSVWAAFPEKWVAVAWGLLAFALVAAGARWKILDVSLQAHGVAALAVLRTGYVNLSSATTHQNDGWRLTTVLLVVALLYLSSRWAGVPALGKRGIAAAYTWAGSALVALLAWYELRAEYVSPAWVVLALVLALVGSRLKLHELSHQAHGLAAAAFLGALFVNLDSTAVHRHLDLRLATVLIVVGLLYFCSRWARKSQIFGALVVGQAHTWGASVLLTLLVWYELGSAWVAPVWMALALAWALTGRGMKLGEFSHQAHLLAGVSIVRVLIVNFGTAASGDYHGLSVRLLTVSLVAALLYACARWAHVSGVVGAPGIAEAHTWAATFLAGLLVGFECREWAPVAWCAMALALVTVSRSLKRRDFAWQAHVLAALAFVWVIVVNLGTSGIGHQGLLRPITVAVCAALLYLCSPWSGALESARALWIPEGYTWAGSTLVALLLWYELEPVGVAVAWVVFGLLLFELGFTRQSTSLRLQGYALMTSSFVRIFFVNLAAAGEPGQISPRIYTILPLAAAYFYAYWRLKERSVAFLELERRRKVSEFYCFFGAITLAALIRAEADVNWVVAYWAAFLLVLLALAHALKQKIFLVQGLLLGVAVLYRTLFFNFFQGSYFTTDTWHGRPVTIGTTAALLFLSLFFAFRLRDKSEASRDEIQTRFAKVRQFLYRRPEQFFFFVAVLLLTVLLRLDLSEMVTLAWGAEAVAIFLLALWLGERSYRLTGLGLLLLCVAKILLVDVWELHGSNRYLTLIGLGIALLVVSALYTRFREAIHRYL